jgi:opacity protein-like surface antigen
MRRSLAILWLIALVSNAAGQEFELPPLRGSTPYIPSPPVYYRWSGVYVGGEIGYAPSTMTFGNSSGTLVAEILRFSRLKNEFHPETWPSIPQAFPKTGTFGGFVGYNSQWDDVVLGFEFNYTHSGLSGAGADVISRRVRLSDDFNYDVTVSASESMKVHDYFTGRVRAGYAVAQFLPYITAGFAVGIIDYTKTASVDYPQPTYAITPPPPPPPTSPTPFSATQTQTKKNAISLGYAAGGGVDVAVLPNMFLRAEYEFVALPIAHMNVLMHNMRLAAALKF